MPKFTLICDHSCDLDTHVVTHQFNAEHLYDVLENIEMFLKGAGYSYDGAIDIVRLDEFHSEHWFDSERNR